MRKVTVQKLAAIQRYCANGRYKFDLCKMFAKIQYNINSHPFAIACSKCDPFVAITAARIDCISNSFSHADDITANAKLFKLEHRQEYA